MFYAVWLNLEDRTEVTVMLIESGANVDIVDEVSIAAGKKHWGI